MLKKYPITLLFIISLSVIGSKPVIWSSPAGASTDGGKTITLLYSGDMHGNIRPIYE